MHFLVLVAWLAFNSLLIILLLSRVRELQRIVRYTSRQQNYLFYKLIDSLNPGGAARVIFYATIDGEKRKVIKMFLKDDQSLPVSVEFVDAKGNAAKVDGAPVWAVSDEALATLDVAADGLSAVVKPVGPLGSFKLQVKADADLGEGVKEILGELDIEVIGGEAVAVNIKAGEPV